LLAEGSARARGGRLAAIDLDRFAAAVAAVATALETGSAPSVPRFPRRAP
jgi:hypothetical protein